jgi:hypothetical protein
VFEKVRLADHSRGTVVASVSGMATHANHDHNEQRRPEQSAPEFQQEKRAVGGWTLAAVLGLIGVLAWFLLTNGS